MPTPADLVPILALVVLLVVAFRQLPGWLEALAGIVAAAVCLPTASSSYAEALTAAGRMLPVVVFLVAILLVAGACAELGLFRAVGERIGRDRGRPQRFLTLTFAAAVAVTAVLSLDATAVLLTLVVLAAARSANLAATPALSACVRLANSSSLLLPVSNLTTLLAMHRLDLSFGRFAWVMAPVWVTVVAVEYAVHRVYFRHDLTPADVGIRVVESGSHPVVEPVETPLPRFPLVVVLLMLVGFALTSLVGLGAAWGAAVVSGVAAVVLVAGCLARGVGSPLALARSAQVGFGVFVLGLAVVVDAISRGGLGSAVSQVLPHPATSWLALVWLAVLATLLANLLNNLPATLLLVPLIAPLGTVPLLAALIGLNVGASLTWAGSLANLLWRRTLVDAGATPSGRTFHAVAAYAVPLGVLLATTVLWAWSAVAL